MKKIAIMLAAALVVVIIAFFGYLAVVSNDEPIKIESGSDLYFYYNTIRGFGNVDRYYIAIFDINYMPEKMVTFSEEREVIKAQKVSPIKDLDINELLNLTLNELEEKLGETHTETGIGYYSTDYITDDAYLITTTFEKDIIVEVVKHDLLTGEIIERVSI